ncbi:zf-HC2 domain-containing protein [Streptomyces sp. NPDC048527]|uniref:zf-HC2 domain-containing protein n=1 Tax=Streptomyces sp. NPDC048527 TaxID=3365568 RepID=UPI003721685F
MRGPPFTPTSEGHMLRRWFRRPPGRLAMTTPRSEHVQASGLLTRYLLGILDGEEDSLVTAHLACCADCEGEVIGLTDTLMAQESSRTTARTADRTPRLTGTRAEPGAPPIRNSECGAG